MVDSLADDIWPAQQGIERLQTLEKSRQLTLRATQKALPKAAPIANDDDYPDHDFRRPALQSGLRDV